MFQIPRTCPTISLRVLSKEGEALTLRQEMDVKIAQIAGVEFVISCLTGTENNKKSKKNFDKQQEKDEEQSTIKKGVAYFVVVATGGVEDGIRQVIASAGFQSQISFICPRGDKRESTDRSLKMLASVMKVCLFAK